MEHERDCAHGLLHGQITCSASYSTDKLGPAQGRVNRLLRTLSVGAGDVVPGPRDPVVLEVYPALVC